MAEQGGDDNRRVAAEDPLGRSAAEDAGATGPSPATPQPFGGEQLDAVDHPVGRTSETVEDLLDVVMASQREIVRLQSRQATLEERLENADRRSPEEIVGEVLLTAHLAAESVIEKAQLEAARVTAEAAREAMPILANARRALEEAGRLRREAHATVEEARLRANAQLEAARAEQERMIADSVADAERRRAKLEAESTRLETAINDLRTEWSGLAADALARLDAIALEASSSPEEDGSVATTGPGIGDPKENAPEARKGDIATELGSRLSGTP